MNLYKHDECDIYEIDNFVNENFCSNIINWFSLQEKTKFSNNDFWSNRTINYSRIFDPVIKQHLSLHRMDRTFAVQNIFKELVYPDYTDIVYWPTGIEMPAHIDDDNGYDYRKFSSVLYLNDNYTGGHTHFDKLGIDIKPVKGKLVIYPSFERYAHGVSKVDGDRYTLSMWFTDRIDCIEV
jgi:hypothetical protein